MVELEDEIRSRIKSFDDINDGRFTVEHPANEKALMVVKFISPEYLEKFVNNNKLFISRTEGFTWGDGVYVVPINHVNSGMMYGQIGVIGWIDKCRLQRVFDATDRVNLEPYQQWISFQSPFFDELTTTVHAGYANRNLRNKFKEEFKIDLVIFRPDEPSTGYADKNNDYWFSLTGEKRPVYTSRVKECKWILILSEHFKRQGQEFISFIGQKDPGRNAHYFGRESDYIVWSRQDTDFIDRCLIQYTNSDYWKKVLVIP